MKYDRFKTILNFEKLHCFSKMWCANLVYDINELSYLFSDPLIIFPIVLRDLLI